MICMKRLRALPMLWLYAAACGGSTAPLPIANDGRPTTGAYFTVAVEALPERNLFDVWGDRDGAVWAVGERGSVFRFQEGQWEEFEAPTTEDLRSVWGRSPAEIYAVGARGTILRYALPEVLPGVGAGEEQEQEPEAVWTIEASPSDSDLNAVSGGGGKVYAAGTGGSLLSRNEEGAWEEVVSGTIETINGLFVDRQGRGVAVGNLGLLLIGDEEGGWERQRIDGMSQALRAVWGTSAESFYVVGLDGTILRSRDGALEAIPGAPKVYLRSVWGLSMGDAWVVGWGGTVLRLDGHKAAPLKGVTDRRLEGVWGRWASDPETEELSPEFWLVGVSGTILLGP